MSISFGVAAAATLVVLVFSGMLVHRCVRTPRLDLAAALCATLGLAAALAAQAFGYYKGFGPTTFRALHLGAQLLAPMALAWALAEMTGKSLGARFAARLALGGLTMVAAVVLASDPLSATPFTKAWPSAAAHYQFIPNAILELIAGVTAVVALLAVIIAGVRARRYPGWRDLFLAVLCAAVGAVATIGLRVTLPANSGYVAICLITASLALFAAVRAGRVRLDVLRFGGPVWDEDTGEFVRYNEDTGEFAPYRDDAGYGYERAGANYRPGQAGAGALGPDGDDSGYAGWFRDDTGGFRRPGSDTDLGGWFRDDSGALHREGADPGYGGYEGADSDYGRPQPPHGANGHGAGFETGDVLPAAAGYPGLAAGAASPEEIARLYGQIAIYTLLDGRAHEFDQLMEHIVEQVKAGEPDTLVYVMHGVPSAPMQRILYEVYRDETAFDEHTRQPYILDFEEERKPYVLATNVIELGVQNAKFSPPAAAPLPPRGQEVRPWGNGSR